jgi:hypothetical protein
MQQEVGGLVRDGEALLGFGVVTINENEADAHIGDETAAERARSAVKGY